ncbi:glycoside hydrolase [Aspergillus ibericus CBS 121593]|uniref:Glycoside hydrolase n=1 Tax=Aspergillus ibericus CBS 121593 TaxID=1448316 RepID=A0A395GVJ8_9EURO|nr:glycoside hydrolase [Aspergillus ibericus CBS 121593]RAK98113.1 glycoside hydrolase [Aspergillus ibericus CBS 121593]
MWGTLPIAQLLVLWLAGQGSALSSSVLESGFNSPANVSARARVQKPPRCPAKCDSYDATQWFVYPSTTRVSKCNQTMLLDFMVQNPLNDSATHHTIYSCTTTGSDGLESASGGTSCASAISTLDANYEVGRWDAEATTKSSPGIKGNQTLMALQEMQTYLLGNCQKSTIFAYSEVENVAAAIYVGGSLERAQNIHALLDGVADLFDNVQSSDRWVWQSCGRNANYTLGIAVDLHGDLAGVQQHVRTWSDGACVSGFTASDTGSIRLLSIDPTNVSTANASSPVTGNTTSVVHSRSPSAHGHSLSHGHARHSLHRRSTCSYVQVISGDSCASLVEECGISADDFYDYNPSSDLCSTLTVGQYVCCSSGDLPDFAPSAYANGTCCTYDVVSGDSCSALAATYSLTEDEIDSFNSDTWGWYGCDDLQAGQSICLSNGTAPYPVALANAVCGPQVPGTNFTDTTVGDWATLNPCPLNACCDIWGQCGATPDYCNDTLAASDAPGTAPPGSNGCISNCGTTIVNTATAPSSFSAVGYFEASNVERPCLQMNAFTISPEKFTHVHFAFGNITSNFSISIAGAEQQFTYFRELENIKRIVSFGGWDFSTSPDTYMIFREGVAAANRDTLVQNVVDFLDEYDLDGVDFDWEYPGEPDIEGIPARSDEDGSNYLEFLTALREALPSKSISISAPASY